MIVEVVEVAVAVLVSGDSGGSAITAVVVVVVAELVGATRGVMVSTSAFLACHQCYCTGSSLSWIYRL